jgi:phage terminase large subunit-like protein
VAEDDEEDDAEDTVDPVNVARVAVALDRLERKVKARRAYLEKSAPDRVEENVTALRAQIEPELLAVCRVAAPGLDEDRVRAVADSVMAGEPPHLAAARLLDAASRTKVDPVVYLAASVAQLAGSVAAQPAPPAPVVNVTAPPALTPEAARALGEGLRPEPSTPPKAKVLTYQRDEKGRVLGMTLEN